MQRSATPSIPASHWRRNYTRGWSLGTLDDGHSFLLSAKYDRRWTMISPGMASVCCCTCQCNASDLCVLTYVQHPSVTARVRVCDMLARGTYIPYGPEPETWSMVLRCNLANPPQANRDGSRSDVSTAISLSPVRCDAMRSRIWRARSPNVLPQAGCDIRSYCTNIPRKPRLHD